MKIYVLQPLRKESNHVEEEFPSFFYTISRFLRPETYPKSLYFKSPDPPQKKLTIFWGVCVITLLREILFTSEGEIGAETLYFIATEVVHKKVKFLLKLSETLA